jgi:hypothetical protein
MNSGDARELHGDSQVSELARAVKVAEVHLRNLARSLEGLRDAQRHHRWEKGDGAKLPDDLIPSAAIYGKAIRMTQKDLAAALDGFLRKCDSQ